MAAKTTCPRPFAQALGQEVIEEFPKPLRIRSGELRTHCNKWHSTACFDVLRGILEICDRMWKVWAGSGRCNRWPSHLSSLLLCLCLDTSHNGSCQKGPELALTNFYICDMAPSQSEASPSRDSPWRVSRAFDHSFFAWNRNTVTKCLTTYRQLDVQAEYKGQVILQRQIPLQFALKHRRRRSFSIEMKNNHGQLTKNWGDYIQADLGSDSITLNYFYRNVI